MNVVPYQLIPAEMYRTGRETEYATNFPDLIRHQKMFFGFPNTKNADFSVLLLAWKIVIKRQKGRTAGDLDRQKWWFSDERNEREERGKEETERGGKRSSTPQEYTMMTAYLPLYCFIPFLMLPKLVWSKRFELVGFFHKRKKQGAFNIPCTSKRNSKAWHTY